EGGGGVEGERGEGGEGGVRSIAPGVGVVWPVGREEEQSRGTEARDETIEHGLSLDVDPVKVFEDQEDRLLAGLAQQQSRHRVERASPAFARIERPPLVIVGRNIEQGEQRR